MSDEVREIVAKALYEVMTPDRVLTWYELETIERLRWRDRAEQLIRKVLFGGKM